MRSHCGAILGWVLAKQEQDKTHNDIFNIPHFFLFALDILKLYYFTS